MPMRRDVQRASAIRRMLRTTEACGGPCTSRPSSGPHYSGPSSAAPKRRTWQRRTIGLPYPAATLLVPCEAIAAQVGPR
jgi:hypothetical protein